jgi:hypothetical protein
MTDITDTALLYNDNVFELPLKNKPKERNSNKQLAFEIFDRYLL